MLLFSDLTQIIKLEKGLDLQGHTHQSRDSDELPVLICDYKVQTTYSS